MTEHYCEVHKCKFYENTKGDKTWYSHKIKGEDGYCNETKLTLDASKLPPPTTPPPMTHPAAPAMPARPDKILSKEELGTMGKQDWAEKDRVTRKSIERQTALNAAVEVARLASAAIPTTVVTTDKLIATAKLFEAYLEGKEVQPAKSLVEAAKELGFKEIPKEGK